MTFQRTYLDYNASAPLLGEARAAMEAALDLVGNPSSVHGEGRRLRGVIEQARERVAALVNARPSEVIFTSGATEANVTAIAHRSIQILMAAIEHDSVLGPIRAGGATIREIPVNADGVIDAGNLAADVLAGRVAPRAMIALQMANNETGVIQPLAEVADFAREHDLSVHTDAVQAAGRMPIDFAALGVDTLALSAHKIGGPQGIGALIVRDGFDLAPLMTGGGQERRRRAGTENAAAIAGFGAAAKIASARLSQAAKIAELRDRLEAGLLQATPNAVIFGHDAKRLPNTCCIGVPGRASEIMLIKLDVAGFAVSAGSACSSGKVGTSHVLTAMGVPVELARGAIRISLGDDTTATEIDAFIAAWATIHATGSSRVAMPNNTTIRAGAGALAIALAPAPEQQAGTGD